MNVLKYRVSLDMFDTLSQTTIKAKKGDSACQIHITLTEKGKIYKIGKGCYATFNAKKSDGNFIYDKCTIEGNTIVYDFASSIDEDGNAQISACEGIVECEVTLYNAESHQLTSPRFTLFIDGTVYNGEEIISTPESNVLKELINEIKNVKAKNYVGVVQAIESLQISPDLASGVYLLRKGATVEYLEYSASMYQYAIAIENIAVDTEIAILDSYIEDGINKRKVYMGEGITEKSYGSVWIYSWKSNDVIGITASLDKVEQSSGSAKAEVKDDILYLIQSGGSLKTTITKENVLVIN